jgi:hypothetical protein
MGSPDLDEDGNIIIGNIISLAHQNGCRVLVISK